MNPYITLPVWEHQIEPIVDDGIDLSGPDYCTATVISAVKAKLFLAPQVLNEQGRDGQIIAMLSMPEGVRRSDIDHSEPLVFYPSEVQSRYSCVFELYDRSGKQVYVMGAFDKSDCLDNLSVGFNDVQIAGRFKSGRYFYGGGRLYVAGQHRLWRIAAPVGR